MEYGLALRTDKLFAPHLTLFRRILRKYLKLIKNVSFQILTDSSFRIVFLHTPTLTLHNLTVDTVSLHNLRTNQPDTDIIFIIARMTKLLGSLLVSKLNSTQVAPASQEMRVVGVTRALHPYTVHSPDGPHDSRR
jgi:hypothetical protein